MNEQKLRNYLMKCELQYRADHLEKGTAGQLDWLAEHCDCLEDIQRFLRELGFRVRAVVDDADCTGHVCRWVTTTSGIIVYENTKDLCGLFAKASQ